MRKQGMRLDRLLVDIVIPIKYIDRVIGNGLLPLFLDMELLHRHLLPLETPGGVK